jgi:hypothetical protein
VGGWRVGCWRVAAPRGGWACAGCVQGALVSTRTLPAWPVAPGSRPCLLHPPPPPGTRTFHLSHQGNQLAEQAAGIDPQRRSIEQHQPSILRGHLLPEALGVLPQLLQALALLQQLLVPGQHLPHAVPLQMRRLFRQAGQHGLQPCGALRPALPHFQVAQGGGAHAV